jgi:hypothetical protein
MNKLKSLIGISAVIAMLFLVGCETSNGVDAVGEQESPTLLKVGRTNVWADCQLYASVVTPATFNANSDPFDQLYAADLTSFKDGIGLISESKPGDQDYNGGRWHLNVLKSTVDSDKYINACKVEDLDLNDFESTQNYFECPLLPRRN